MPEPRELVEEMERDASLPSGSEERFAGYGVIGLPFASGHVLAMRRFPVSSVGESYTSIWHRDREGAWSMFVSVPAAQACPRYFGSALAQADQVPIDIDWTGERSFRITVDGGATLDWTVSLGQTPVMTAMNAIGALMPDALWRKPAVLTVMGALASAVLGAGKLGLAGVAPNGQTFVANPMRMWSISENKATLRGEDLGQPGPLTEQTRLGDFWIPQRGIFTLGRAFFEPFDEARHQAATSRAG